MSNLETAKTAIETEIAHAKNGMAYYATRIKALEQALVELSHVGEVAAATTTGPTRAKSKKKVGAKKTAGRAKQLGDLPSTGGDYWPNLVTEQPQHSSEILQSAIDRLGFTPTKDQAKKLTQRMIFALNALVKAGKIQDSGTGRARRFLKTA